MYPLSVEERVLLHQWYDNAKDTGCLWPPTPYWTAITEGTLEQVKEPSTYGESNGWARYLGINNNEDHKLD